jgi:5-methylcytosine-specific restriction endonuclease McrA
MLKLIPLSILTMLLTVNFNAQPSSDQPRVKQSSSGICHDNSSSSYKRTKKYTAFESISACTAAGGRLPKSATKKMDEALNEAAMQGRDFVTLYNRSDWPHWSDEDKDCQNTRHELLISTSSEAVSYKTDKQCNVLAGKWYDPYSGETFTISKDLDLDHIVPLKFAHGHGADKWSRERKAMFANDLDNLILTKASLNRQKGAKGLTEWLIPNFPYRCEYIARFNAVMAKYELSYIPSVQRIVNRMVKACIN